jgi:hypothetical protein
MPILTLRPDTDISGGELTTYGGGGVPHHCVNEETPDDNTTYLYSTGIAVVSNSFDLVGYTSQTGTINSVKVYFRCKGESNTYVAKAKAGVHISQGAAYYGTEYNQTTSWANFDHTWSTNPADSQAWAWTDMLLRITLTGANDGKADYKSYCTQLYAAVDCAAASARSWAVTCGIIGGLLVPASGLFMPNGQFMAIGAKA